MGKISPAAALVNLLNIGFDGVVSAEGCIRLNDGENGGDMRTIIAYNGRFTIERADTVVRASNWYAIRSPNRRMLIQVMKDPEHGARIWPGNKKGVTEIEVPLYQHRYLTLTSLRNIKHEFIVV
jgi:hypothetical protein